MYKSILFTLGCSVLAACGADSSLVSESGTSDKQSLFFDYEKDTVTLVGRQAVDVVVTKNNDTNSHEVELTAFGRTVTFTKDDFAYDAEGNVVNGDIYRKTLSDGTFVKLISWEGTWEQAHNRGLGYRYLVPYYASSYSEDDENAEYFFGVYGTETSADNMPPSGRVTYTGTAYEIRYDTSDSDTYYNDYEDIYTEIVADFGASTVYGSMGGLFIDETSITGNTFSTTISVDESTCRPECITITSSQVDGTFFGSSAQEVGGSFSFTSEADGDEYVDVGYFIAAKQ